jgi:hypothetical protein
MMDTNPSPRIFVSSIMTGYGAVRAAASRGIERAACEPVLAENFPPGTVSPRTACLDGVASCDGIVLILGDRYGEPTAAGISATEEEYREAVRLKKHIFVFLEGGDREPRQQEFVRSIEDYVDGHWRKTFRTPEELEQLVEQALREGRPMVAAGSAEGGSRERIGAAFAERPDRVDGIVWAQVAWTTPRDEEVVDPTTFMNTGFQRDIQRLAHEGDTSLFDYGQAKDTRVEASRLRITQGNPSSWRGGRDLVVVDLYENGTLSVALNVTGLTGGDAMRDIGQMYRIDPNDVRRRLEGAWSFAARWWEYHDPYRRHEPLLYNTVLHDVGARRLEVAPQHPTNSVTIPATCPHDPLWIYDRLRKVVRKDLWNPDGEIKRTLDMTQLRFKEWEGRAF